ncbi:MAG TPA: DNA repair protein RecN, partial [Porphyromonadaceae bacterium]|nr:DNA repair protein RecN [Porphyromonadaceae bacterium]
MLKNLSIRNYILIDSLDIDFHEGFSVLTGETGAGKSIILGALGLVLGKKAEPKLMRKEEKCVIELTFSIENYDLQSFFEENDLDYDAKECILRREILPKGKSRAFINDTPTTLTILKTLGEKLIDVHSQHQNLLLSNYQYQLKVLDCLIPNKALLEEYFTLFKTYKKYQLELKKLQKEEEDAKRDEEFIRFQLEQLNAFHLSDTQEQVLLEQEREMLSHAGEIKSSLYKIEQLFSSEELGAIVSLHKTLNLLRKLDGLLPNISTLTERLESDCIDIEDLSRELSSLSEGISDNPEKLQKVEERLDTLYSLQHKHHVESIEELISLKKGFEEKLSHIEDGGERIMQLQKEVSKYREKVDLAAEKLSSERKKQSLLLRQSIEENVKKLAIPNARFEVRFTSKNEPDENGIDDVCYLFAANKNAPLLPVVDTASGGEISRIMLCIKALIADRTTLPTLIFDEIDTGVSGEVADMMGEIMQKMSQFMQAITLTHLPQIASKGKTHYKVYKEDNEDTTNTHIIQLSSEERIQEVARLLSGSTLTKIAME